MEQDEDVIKVQVIETQEKKIKVWNGLERTKIFVGLLTPVVIVWITSLINSNLNERNKIEEHDRRIYQQRQDIYNKIGPLLNDIYTYHLYIGKWKEITPDSILKQKRDLDQIVYTNIPYFDSASTFIKYYDTFIKATFKTNQGFGKDARLRTDMELHKNFIDTNEIKWVPRFDQMFTGEDNRTQVKDAYFALLKQIAIELDTRMKSTDLGKLVKIDSIDRSKK